MPIYEYPLLILRFQKEYLQKITGSADSVCPECRKSTFAKMLSAAGSAQGQRLVRDRFQEQRLEACREAHGRRRRLPRSQRPKAETSLPRNPTRAPRRPTEGRGLQAGRQYELEVEAAA